ncbi:uncharacterized protein LOC122669494 [Telopea speciosissima]|uniref:uncharacterized protein LOC122669494 n=1 Tax=Telopea speciosissima TaxID=54955 RepID=UPI001CC76C36|nr:uncharacterized protein LOC122669494 [Telopea speciosissima]
MAAKHAQGLFLEEWLRGNSSSSGSSSNNNKPSLSSSARAIIQAWAELRDSLQHQIFQSSHVQSLQTLLNSQTSLHVADPQAKLLLSILNSPHLSPPPESYPFFLRLLYIWVRKSSRPSPPLIETAVTVISRLLSFESDTGKSSSVVSNGILLLGALSLVPFLSKSSKNVCLEMLSNLLEEEYRFIGSSEELVPEVLAGIGYALFASDLVQFGRILDSLLGVWSKDGGPRGRVTHGLMILHLIEWVVSGSVNSPSVEKLEFITREILEMPKPNHAPFAVFMAAAGILRALNKLVPSPSRAGIILQLRKSAEDCIVAISRDMIFKTEGFSHSIDNPEHRLLLQCLSLALARSGSVSPSAPLLSCLASSLLIEIFPLRSLYTMVVQYSRGDSGVLGLNQVKEHVGSILFKEAGAITSAFCNQYVSADEEQKGIVENLIWNYCQDIRSGHRLVALMLQGEGKELLGHLEKIAESAFLMVVIFASVVTKHKLNSKFSRDAQLDISVSILISFSCVEYFRRVRLPEYTDTIRAIVVSVQENENACVSFVNSMPSYTELTNQQGLSCLDKMEYTWSKDDVQTARILFYLRVIPTCIERVPGTVFRKVVAPTMFLYMGHQNGKVSRASHSLFAAFISSGKDSNLDDRVVLKEQLVFYYIQRALEGYPGITPFEGMASGVASLVRHLPAGSPAIFYTIHSLCEKAHSLCIKAMSEDADIWKNWQEDSEPCKKVLELLLHLISLVDIQVLPNLMKLLAQLIIQLPKSGQDVILDEIYALVAESNDVTRKPTLVSWLQSLSYICSQASGSSETTTRGKSKRNDTSGWSIGMSWFDRISSRL